MRLFSDKTLFQQQGPTRFPFIFIFFYIHYFFTNGRQNPQEWVWWSDDVLIPSVRCCFGPNLMANWKVPSMNCSPSVSQLPNTLNMFGTLFFPSAAQAATWRVTSSSSQLNQRQPSHPSTSVAHVQIINNFQQSALHCWLIVSSPQNAVVMTTQLQPPHPRILIFGPFSPDRCWLRLRQKEEHHFLRKVI